MATKMFKVTVTPAPQPSAGSVQVGVNGKAVTVPLHVETEVGEDVYEALQNSGYEVLLVDGDDDKKGETTSRYTDKPLGETVEDPTAPAPESKEKATQRAKSTKQVDAANEKLAGPPETK